MVTAVPVPGASPSRAKRKRLDVRYSYFAQLHAFVGQCSFVDGVFVQSVLRALYRACGLSKDTRPRRVA